MGILAETRVMHRRYRSGWLVALSRVLTIRSSRVQRYLRSSEEERRAEYPWLYRERVRQRPR
jgi:hypothetical protein